MRRRLVSVAAATSFVVAALAARDADACGGCFVAPVETTQVTGHKMILSVSQQSTTLVDQITYDGDPADFAWVLPIRAPVEVGVSSDLVFQLLDSDTAVTITGPSFNCPQPPWCPGDTTTSTTSTTTGGVTVIAEEVVGPFETVQLAATDPDALDNWLAMRGYVIPSDVQPIVSSYLAEGFDFLAIKLVPGESVSAMRPVRVTTPGAGIGLPLRMVAAGTGALTTISLWVLGEGRYEPQNFPSFTIDEDDLVWDWDLGASNYKDLRQEGYDMEGGFGWLVENATGYDIGALQSRILTAAELMPESSGYDTSGPMTAYDEAVEDMQVLTGSINASSAWVTRLRAELTRPALANDLLLQAASPQVALPSTYEVTEEVGVRPQCPQFPPCPEVEEIVDDIKDGTNNGYTTTSSVCGCEAPGGRGGSLASLAVLALALAIARRRR